MRFRASSERSLSCACPPSRGLPTGLAIRAISLSYHSDGDPSRKPYRARGLPSLLPVARWQSAVVRDGGALPAPLRRLSARLALPDSGRGAAARRPGEVPAQQPLGVQPRQVAGVNRRAVLGMYTVLVAMLAIMEGLIPAAIVRIVLGR